MNITKDFYVLCYESGAMHSAVSVWATHHQNPLFLSDERSHLPQRADGLGVPTAFQLLEIFSDDECLSFMDTAKALGYEDDAAISLPRSVRHNQNLVWIIDDLTHDIIWNRCKDSLLDSDGKYKDKKAIGLNKRFRFYKYNKGDFFKAHTDGSWPGSSVLEGKLVQDAYGL